MAINTLNDLLHRELIDIYSAENHVVEVLPRLADCARSEELRTAFEELNDAFRLSPGTKWWWLRSRETWPASLGRLPP